MLDKIFLECPLTFSSKTLPLFSLKMKITFEHNYGKSLTQSQKYDAITTNQTNDKKFIFYFF